MGIRLDSGGAAGLMLMASLATSCAAEAGPDGGVASAPDAVRLDAEEAPLPELGAALVEDPPLAGLRGAGWPRPLVDSSSPNEEPGPGAAEEEEQHEHANEHAH